MTGLTTSRTSAQNALTILRNAVELVRVNRVATGTARDDIALTVFGVDGVVTRAAKDVIITSTVLNDVVTRPAVHPVVPRAGVNRVRPETPSDLVVACAGADAIVSRPRLDDVAESSAVDAVSARCAPSDTRRTGRKRNFASPVSRPPLDRPGVRNSVTTPSNRDHM